MCPSDIYILIRMKSFMFSRGVALIMNGSDPVFNAGEPFMVPKRITSGAYKKTLTGSLNIATSLIMTNSYSALPVLLVTGILIRNAA